MEKKSFKKKLTLSISGSTKNLPDSISYYTVLAICCVFMSRI